MNTIKTNKNIEGLRKEIEHIRKIKYVEGQI